MPCSASSLFSAYQAAKPTRQKFNAPRERGESEFCTQCHHSLPATFSERRWERDGKRKEKRIESSGKWPVLTFLPSNPKSKSASKAFINYETGMRKTGPLHTFLHMGDTMAKKSNKASLLFQRSLFSSCENSLPQFYYILWLTTWRIVFSPQSC